MKKELAIVAGREFDHKVSLIKSDAIKSAREHAAVNGYVINGPDLETLIREAIDDWADETRELYVSGRVDNGLRKLAIRALSNDA